MPRNAFGNAYQLLCAVWLGLVRQYTLYLRVCILKHQQWQALQSIVKSDPPQLPFDAVDHTFYTAPTNVCTWIVRIICCPKNQLNGETQRHVRREEARST